MTTTLDGEQTATLSVEEKLDVLAWLHAEQNQTMLKLATALANLLAQQMQPQIQQAILAKLTG